MEPIPYIFHDIPAHPEVILCILEQLNVRAVFTVAALICRRVSAVVADNVHWLLAHCDHQYMLVSVGLNSERICGRHDHILQRVVALSAATGDMIRVNMPPWSAGAWAHYPFGCAAYFVQLHAAEVSKYDPCVGVMIAIIGTPTLVSGRWTIETTPSSLNIRIATDQVRLYARVGGSVYFDMDGVGLFKTPDIITEQVIAAVNVESAAIVAALWSDSFDLGRVAPGLIAAARDAEERLIGPADI